eukprot:97135-Pyramimonas_sp.AAC.1
MGIYCLPSCDWSYPPVPAGAPPCFRARATPPRGSGRFPSDPPRSPPPPAPAPCAPPSAPTACRPRRP